MKKALYLLSLVTVIAISPLGAQKPQVRDVSSEVNVAKGSLVRILGANRKLVIKSWDQPKVKVTVTFAYDSSTKYTDHEQTFEALGISIKPFSNRVDIVANRNSGSLNAVTVTGYPSKGAAGVQSTAPTGNKQGSGQLSSTTLPVKDVDLDEYSLAYFKGSQKQFSAETVVQRLDIMVPAGSRLDIDNQYGDVVVSTNVDEAKLNISNGALDLQDVKNLQLTGKYCNANFGNIDKAEIEFNNGTIHALSINDLDLDSKYSTIEYEKGKDLYLRSQADNITIDEISKVEGRKIYGSVRIDRLNEGFDLEGNNVDIKIREISPQVEKIKIHNKYGDVRLQVRSLKNYFVDFTGYYSTVFTPFAKTIVKEGENNQAAGNAEEAREKEMADMANAGAYFRSSATLAGELAPKRFTGTVGDINGKHTRFELTCHSCTVDFK